MTDELMPIQKMIYEIRGHKVMLDLAIDIFKKTNDN
jgi:hypothetical protein